MNENPKPKISKQGFVGKTDGLFLDNYDVIKQLGSGGYGKVYEVRNKKSQAIYACKHLSKLNIKNQERFQREIDILVKSDHPNIIRLFELFESQRSYYIVMEECKGGEIFDRIIEHIQNKQMYSEKEAAEIFKQVMSAICYCHNNGICHRDLKPENLLYLNAGSEKNNPIKVIDFGLSQYFDKKRKLTTKVGTAYYVSPEILKGEYTEKCDVWSAGVILYIFLCGDPPFNGPNDTAIYDKIVQQKFEFPEKKWKNISKEAKDLISHMIAPENERYTSAQVLQHPWFNNSLTEPLSALNFDINFFINFVKSSELKKMALLYIASRLDDNEIIDLRKAFEAFDTCKDGQITITELKQGLMQLKSKLTEDEIVNIFKSIDVDQNGKIDYTEFLAATIQEKNYARNEKLFDAFCKFDKDNSGQITKEEILQVLKCDSSKGQDIEKFIKVADKNGDGKIDYKEFIELMK
jgi:calcium-dependent protein kinase